MIYDRDNMVGIETYFPDDKRIKEMLPDLSLRIVQMMVDYNQRVSPEEKLGGIVQLLSSCAHSPELLFGDKKKDRKFSRISSQLKKRYHPVTTSDLALLAERTPFFYVPLSLLVAHFYWESYDLGKPIKELEKLHPDGIPLRVILQDIF